MVSNASRSPRLSSRSHLAEARLKDEARQQSEETQPDIDPQDPDDAQDDAPAEAAVWSSVVAKESANGKVKTTVHLLPARRAFLRRANYITERSMSDLVDEALELLERKLQLDP